MNWSGSIAVFPGQFVTRSEECFCLLPYSIICYIKVMVAPNVANKYFSKTGQKCVKNSYQYEKQSIKILPISATKVLLFNVVGQSARLIALFTQSFFMLLGSVKCPFEKISLKENLFVLYTGGNRI